MYAAVTVLALLFLCACAYAAAARKHSLLLAGRLAHIQSRETGVLEAVRALTAASRESTGAVLSALDDALRRLEPAVDCVIVFSAQAQELVCVYAGGQRAGYYRQLRLARESDDWLPVRAANCGHRIALKSGVRGVVPTDRAALAVPLRDGDRLAAVVYVSTTGERIPNAELLVRAVEHAASPYALAAEREADRAQATYDSLTGLHTPRAFRSRLSEEVRVAHLRGDRSICLWFIDTDRFKHVNDTLGHAAGDLVLQRMALLLRAFTVTGVDVPARNGGDEFCAILAQTQKTAAIERAHAFCRAVRAQDFGAGISITASIGVAAFPFDAHEASALLEAADRAMYHSKRAGRNCVSFCVPGGGFEVYR